MKSYVKFVIVLDDMLIIFEMVYFSFKWSHSMKQNMAGPVFLPTTTLLLMTKYSMSPNEKYKKVVFSLLNSFIFYLGIKLVHNSYRILIDIYQLLAGSKKFAFGDSFPRNLNFKLANKEPVAPVHTFNKEMQTHGSKSKGKTIG
jgi:hypothetical protein